MLGKMVWPFIKHVIKGAVIHNSMRPLPVHYKQYAILQLQRILNEAKGTMVMKSGKPYQLNFPHSTQFVSQVLDNMN